MVLGVLVFSFKGADESEESKCAGSPKEETRHGQTAEEGAVAEHRGGQIMMLYLILEKSY